MIKRSFVDLTDDEVEDVEHQALLRDLGLRKRLDWDALLQSRRILLLSEAQSGKTFECRRQQRLLWKAGHPAFFVELASVARQPWRELRTVDEDERFERWRRSGGETATVFLDSIDELQLTAGSFRTALNTVAKELAGNLGRVVVVLTSRPLRVDRDLFASLLPVPVVIERPSDAAFARAAMGEPAPAREAEPPAWRSVKLMRIGGDDIAAVARSRGVTDPDTLIAALRQSSMYEFVKRPQDVIEAAAAWQALGGKLGTHAQQVAFDIAARLKPNPDRQDRPLAADRA